MYELEANLGYVIMNNILVSIPYNTPDNSSKTRNLDK